MQNPFRPVVCTRNHRRRRDLVFKSARKTLQKSLNQKGLLGGLATKEQERGREEL